VALRGEVEVSGGKAREEKLKKSFSDLPKIV